MMNGIPYQNEERFIRRIRKKGSQGIVKHGAKSPNFNTFRFLSKKKGACGPF
jgi:hypothetical protein